MAEIGVESLESNSIEAENNEAQCGWCIPSLSQVMFVLCRHSLLSHATSLVYFFVDIMLAVITV